jgi:predicted Zn-dependent peptidase
MWGQDPVIIAKRLERINALTAATIKDAFNKYFPAERQTVITLVPAAKRRVATRSTTRTSGSRSRR